MVSGAAILVATVLSTPAVGARITPRLPALHAEWTINFDGTHAGIPSDINKPIAQSSPVLAMIDGTPSSPEGAIVVGDRKGRLYAANLVTGSLRVLYSSKVSIDAPPSAAPVTPGALDTVFFGRGNQEIACRATDGTWGGYTAIDADGSVRWKRRVNNPPGDLSCPHNGVMAGMTLVDLKGTLSTFGMSLGQAEHGFTAATGTALTGWNPWFQADSSTSTVALAWLRGVSKAPSIIEGGDSTQGNAYGYQYYNGGHVRVVAAKGNGGVPGNGGLRCSFDTYANGGQIVAASPAVGTFLAGGATGIASGQGYFAGYGGPVNRLRVLDQSCQKVWSAQTDFLTSSPILADVDGDGHLDVVVGTQDVSVHGLSDNGSVSAYDGATGRLLWKTETGSVIGQPVAADLRNTGHADVVVGTTSGSAEHGGLQILDGSTGTKQWSTYDFVTQGTPIVTADPSGKIGITVAGYFGVLVGGEVHLAGTIRHFSVTGSSASWLANPTTSWLEFHHDARLTGNASPPAP